LIVEKASMISCDGVRTRIGRKGVLEMGDAPIHPSAKEYDDLTLC
jgi:hypothetical protein